MRKFKKIIFMGILAILMFSMAVMTTLGTIAAIDEKGCYVPSADVTETYRYYFYMPSEWYTNEEINTAGVYWWSGKDACNVVNDTGETISWPGYKAQAVDDIPSLYYVDISTDVHKFIWNNFFDGRF